MNNANKDLAKIVFQIGKAAWEGYKAYQEIDKINKKNQKRLR